MKINKKLIGCRCMGLLLLLLSAVISSCSEDAALVGNEGERAGIKVVLAKMNPHSNLGELAGEEEIRSVRMLVFNENGFIDRQKLFLGSELKNPFRMEVQEGKNKSVVIIANENLREKEELEKVVTKKELHAIRLSSRNSGLTAPFVMTGEVNVNVARGGANFAQIELKRAVAKLTFTLKKQLVNENDRVIVREVKFQRVNRSSSLLPDGSRKDDFRTVSYDCSGMGEEESLEVIPMEKPLYIYENRGGRADTTGRAMKVEVSALYNGIPTTYTAYINDESAEQGESAYSVERNRHYHIDAVITRMGKSNVLLLQTTVEPWHNEKLEAEFSRPVFTKINIDRHSLDWANIYNVSAQRPLEVSVSIRGLANNEWTATLTNGLDFEIEGQTSGKADGVSEAIFKIRPRNRYTSRVRRCRLYFVVEDNFVTESGNLKHHEIELIQMPNL